MGYLVHVKESRVLSIIGTPAGECDTNHFARNCLRT